ncbi:MFS transporter, partial [Streptomyces sp. 150FB]|uniref:MFS transporter n=1 Tax=Streptomyces sp. 150FB TaxID=1576605 RepID=UPI0012373B90
MSPRSLFAHRSVPAGGGSVLASPSPRRVLLLPLLAVGMFAIGTDGYVIAGLLPPMSRDLGVSESAAGQLVTVFALAYAVGAPLLGIAIGGLRRRPVLVGSLTLFAATNVAAALVHSYAAMLAVRVVAALSAAVFTPAAAAVAPELVPVGRRGRALGTIGAGTAVATALGVPLGTLIGGAYGWRATFLAVAALGVPAVVGVVALLPALPLRSPASPA